MASEAQIAANRENAKLGGRPHGTTRLEAQLFRAALAKRINENAEEWISAIENMALGRNGEKPNADAWQKAMDRSFGKPEQAVDHTTNGRELPAPILSVITTPPAESDVQSKKE